MIFISDISLGKDMVDKCSQDGRQKERADIEQFSMQTLGVFPQIYECD
jgi:hypothetical protein